MLPLPRPRAGLHSHRVDDQVLVYDAREDRTHLLDPTTACVLGLLEKGGRSAEELAHELRQRTGVASSESLISLALDELRKADLLEERAAPAPLTEVSRRDMLRRAGLASASALLLPTVVTLTARPAYAQSQCISTKNDGPCTGTGSRPCCSNLTCNTSANKCQ